MEKRQATPHKIIDNLYLGNFVDSQNKEHLLKLGVKYILIVSNHLTVNFPNVKRNY